jgi:RimJ/RimL family protein N-acetyltransferase
MDAKFAVETPHLRLRTVEPADAESIQKAAKAREISDTMISIPHPYPEGEAERYVKRQMEGRQAGHSMAFAIEHKEDEKFLGVLELRKIDAEHLLAEMSFWLIPEVWGQGYMSEVVQVVIKYAFEDLGLNRLYAYCMVRNPATGRVLEKNGFRQEGLLRQRVRKWGEFEDVLLWAILREEWRELH